MGGGGGGRGGRGWGSSACRQGLVGEGPEGFEELSSCECVCVCQAHGWVWQGPTSACGENVHPEPTYKAPDPQPRNYRGKHKQLPNTHHRLRLALREPHPRIRSAGGESHVEVLCVGVLFLGRLAEARGGVGVGGSQPTHTYMVLNVDRSIDPI